MRLDCRAHCCPCQAATFCQDYSSICSLLSVGRSEAEHGSKQRKVPRCFDLRRSDHVAVHMKPVILLGSSGGRVLNRRNQGCLLNLLAGHIQWHFSTFSDATAMDGAARKSPSPSFSQLIPIDRQPSPANQVLLFPIVFSIHQGRMVLLHRFSASGARMTCLDCMSCTHLDGADEL